MKKSFLWNTIGNIMYLFALWFITIVITRILGYEQNGIFTIAMSLGNVLYVFSSYGLRGFQVSDIKKAYSDTDYVFNRFLTVLASLIITFIVAVVMGYNTYTILIIMLFMIFKSCESLSDVFHGILQNNEKLYLAGISLFLKGIGCIFLFTISVYFTKKMWLGLIIMDFYASFLLFWDIKNSKHNIFSLSSGVKKHFFKSLQLMKEALPMMLFSMTTPLIASIPKIALEKYCGSELLGIYSSISVPSVIVSSLISCILIPLIPKWTKFYNSSELKPLARSFLLSCIISLSIGILGTVCSVFLGEFFLCIVFGDSIREYAYYLNYVMIISTITALIMCCNNYMVVARKLYTLLVISFIGCVLCLIFSIIFIPNKNISGVIIALLLSEITQVLSMILYILYDFFRKKRINETSSELKC